MEHYIVKKLCRLTEKQRNDIRKLSGICREWDGTKAEPYLSTDMNFDRRIRSFFLCYIETELIGFIGLFAPEEKDVEAVAFTRPDKRRKGVFSRLNEYVCEELKCFGVSEIRYIHEPKSSDGKSALNAIGAQYSYSEYLMQYQADNQAESIDIAGLVLCEACEADKTDLIPLLMDMSFAPENETEVWFDQIEQDRDMGMLKLICNDKIIGVANINEGKDSICIFGVVITSQLRGKGFGRALIQMLIQKLEKRGKRIILQVSSKNKPAYNIYVKTGFIIIEQQDYYQINIGKIIF